MQNLLSVFCELRWLDLYSVNFESDYLTSFASAIWFWILIASSFHSYDTFSHVIAS